MIRIYSTGISGVVTYSFAIRIVEGLELDDVWMADNAHDLQLTVLAWRTSVMNDSENKSHAHLESLVL